MDYINYITKNMVADYNPQIVGPVNFKDNEGDFDVTREDDTQDDGKTPLEKKIDRLSDKIDTIEDILEIEPGFPEAVEITKKELDLTPLEDKIASAEEEKIEKEIEEEE